MATDESREYATHIVNSELLGDTDWSEEFSEQFSTVGEFAAYLDDYVHEMVSDTAGNGLAENLARRFLSDVDWRELAEMYASDHPGIMEPDIEECSDCDGSGEIPEENGDGSETGEMIDCPRCDGTGEITVAWSPAS